MTPEQSRVVSVLNRAYAKTLKNIERNAMKKIKKEDKSLYWLLHEHDIAVGLAVRLYEPEYEQEEE